MATVSGGERGKLTSEEFLNPQKQTDKETKAALSRTEVWITEACHHKVMSSPVFISILNKQIIQKTKELSGKDVLIRGVIGKQAVTSQFWKSLRGNKREQRPV